MAKYKVYIIEDHEDTFDEYQAIFSSLVPTKDFPYSLEVVSDKPTSLMTFEETLNQLRERQPDIIFLDFDLVWKNNNPDKPKSRWYSGNAIDVIKVIQDVYSRSNFPPYVVLNTLKPEKKDDLFKALSFKEARVDYPKDFLAALSGHFFSSDFDAIKKTIGEGIQLLESERMSVTASSLTIHGYHTDHSVTLANVNHESFVSQSNKTEWFNTVKIKIRRDSVYLSHKNILCITMNLEFGHRNGRYGSIVTLDKHDNIQVYLLTSVTKKAIREFLVTNKLSSVIHELNPDLFYNTTYLEIVRTSQLKFLTEHLDIKATLIQFLDKEGKFYASSLYEHALFHPLSCIEGF